MRSWHRSCLCPPCGHVTSWERCIRSSTGFWHRVGIYRAASTAAVSSPMLRPPLAREAAGVASRAKTRSSATVDAGKTIITIIGSKDLPDANRHRSSSTLRARTYSGSGTPGTFVPCHPLHEFFCFVGTASGTGQQVGCVLARCDVGDPVPLLVPLVHTRIEGLGQDDVGADLGRAEGEALGGILDVVDEKDGEARGGHRSDACRTERTGYGVPEIRVAEFAKQGIEAPWFYVRARTVTTE